MLLGIDLGTTHCKAGMFQRDGTPISTVSLDMPLETWHDGSRVYDPETVWQVVKQAVQQVSNSPIQAVGVASMAESGLLVDRYTGAARTPLIPWHNRSAESYVSLLATDPAQRFARTGIRPNYKCALAKLLWLKDHDPHLLKDAVWLSTADYILYRLTGVFVTDYSLAGRTYTFDIFAKQWDSKWLAKLDLPENLFPPAYPAGKIFASTCDVLPPDTPVCIAGHDHVCAALAAGAVQSGIVLDSIGTAETLIGAWNGGTLGQRREYASGLLFGCHVIPDHYYWMGSLSASGGSVEWLRGHFGGMPYEEIETAIQQISNPTGILYFPYLAGSSLAGYMKAAFIGLEQSHGVGHLLKAVIEGTAYEVENLRRVLLYTLAIEASQFIVAGGATYNAAWMQIKADVSGCAYQILPHPQATLLGAAMVAGIGSGIYADAPDAITQATPQQMTTVTPNPEHHLIYRHLFEDGYLKLIQPLRDYYTRTI